ncbi:hypothetical protein C1I64_16820 [Rathayibacter festucae DSM 15932]|uniref:Uncharacterized protein n=1 Tax=Rathayibacter festucae DSM 15932 TaxID=1328866 RepID=A0A3Q9UYY8_9MICO|nr:hypothetical protein C1I64_16820 [Rathayibacter festucae DSM 15932]
MGLLQFPGAAMSQRPLAAILFIGPSCDGTVTLEVFAHLNLRAQDVLIFHVLPLRRSTLERVRETTEERRNPT